MSTDKSVQKVEFQKRNVYRTSFEGKSENNLNDRPTMDLEGGRQREEKFLPCHFF